MRAGYSDNVIEVAPMSVLDELRPTKKLLVIDLLREAGADVSKWKNYKGKSPAANPKYCYNWSFEQPGEFIAAYLWFPSLKAHGKNVFYPVNPKSRGARRDLCSIFRKLH
jgi:5-methylcytosine-specific restriction enzyme A